MLNTIVYIYLIFGIIMVSIGPLSKDLFNEIKMTKSDNSKSFIIRKTTFALTLIVAGIVLYPIYYYSYYFQNGKKINNIKKLKYDDSKLYFHRTAGIGKITCKDCNNDEKITSFTHGYDSKTGKRCDNTGYQCKDCGKFQTLFGFEHEKTVVKNCECGGKLEREKPLFCSKCKSYKVLYHLEYMT
jgi:hypothetical protein